MTDILEIRNVNNLDIKLKERDHFEDIGKDGGIIILKWSSVQYDVRV